MLQEECFVLSLRGKDTKIDQKTNASNSKNVAFAIGLVSDLLSDGKFFVDRSCVEYLAKDG